MDSEALNVEVEFSPEDSARIEAITPEGMTYAGVIINLALIGLAAVESVPAIFQAIS